MKCRRLNFFLLFVAFFSNISLLHSQEPPLVPQIINPVSNVLPYCSDSVLIAPEITVTNITIDEATEGMKISIINYKAGEDTLGFIEMPKFNYLWDNFYGILFITGIGTSEEYQDAIRKVYYKNIANAPRLIKRTFVIGLLDADYLPSTKHFYRYIKKLDISWKEAKAAADTMSYYGLQGYLATITSAEENDFIWTKIDGVGWIGASDEETEGDWKWVTGPEKGQQFWKGNVNGQSVNGMYSNWASGEPNNSGNEAFAHINQNPNKASKSWNDLKNSGDGPNSAYYRAQGFVVEFGGMPNEPEVKLSAIVEIDIRKIAFSDVRNYEICTGESKQLNLLASNLYNYNWFPNENISDLTTSNPRVNPTKTTTYKAVGRLDYCIDSALFTVNVNPVPVHNWDSVNVICEGASIQLNPGSHTSYLWGNSETSNTLTVYGEGWYTVKLTNEYNCTSIDSTLVKKNKMPTLDYSMVDTIICGEKEQELSLKFNEGDAATKLISMQTGADVLNETSLTPTVYVDEFGIYKFKLELRDQNQCSFFDTLKLEFHNQPDALFQMDEAECEGYNLKLYYKGITHEDALFEWYSSDTVFYSGINVDSVEIPLGFGVSNRSVGLIINEKGCIDSLQIPVTVTPVLNFWPVQAEGCTPLKVNFDFQASETVDNFYWEFGDGYISSDPKPSHIYQNKMEVDLKYDVGLKIMSAEGCENKGFLKDTVIVHPIPTVDFSFSENDCSNKTDTIWYSGSANENDKYFWDLSAFTTDEILQNPGNSPGPLIFSLISEPTVKIGIKVLSAFGCNSDSILKTLKRKPVFDVLVDKTEGCPPFKTDFSAYTLDEVDQINYDWDFGDGNNGTGSIVSNEFYEADRKHDITVIANSSLTNCSDTLFLSEKIYTYPIPKAGFVSNPSTVLISNPIVNFENNSQGADFYEWNFGDNSIRSDEVNPVHQYSKMGFYKVGLNAFNRFGCSNMAENDLAVAFDRVYPPNAFSPNALLPENREFRIYSDGIESDGFRLLIFNRWGEIVFESKSQLYGWNGKMNNGNFAPAGVYTWVVEFVDFLGEKHKQKGTFTLLF